MAAKVTGPELAVATCLRRLAPLEPEPDGGELDLECTISWQVPADLPGPADEVTVQARCGLMHVHGWDRGVPRRLGLEVGSVAAGVLAAQAVTAAMIGRRRGRHVAGVETSVLQAALLLMSHYVAAATADEPVSVPGGPDPGPPFPTADGQWFEIETFDAEAWRSFWLRLGAVGVDLGRAWTAFRWRYYRGVCSLPPGLHEAAARHTAAQTSEVADACRVSFVRVRDYREVLYRPGPWPGHPVLDWSGPPEDWAAGPAEGTPPAPALPLEGLTLVEASNRMQGPLAGMLLQHLGARVVRVEPPGGDVGRMVPPLAGDTGSFFLCFNRGKEAVELDLASPAGRSQLLELVADADVFLHNWRPGKSVEWGLAFEDLARVNPRLVYAQASGWGQEPEVADLIGTDFLIQAYAGVGHGLNPDDEPPFPTRVLVTDFMGALVTCEGILAGLYRREQTGRGGQVGTSLLSGAMALQAHVLAALAEGREDGRRAGRPVWGAVQRPLPTSDGWLAVSSGSEADLRRLAGVCAVAGDGATRQEVEARVTERLAGAPAARWEEELSAEGIPAAVVCTDLARLPTDPSLAPLFEAVSPTCRVPASPWRFSW